MTIKDFRFTEVLLSYTVKNNKFELNLCKGTQNIIILLYNCTKKLSNVLIFTAICDTIYNIDIILWGNTTYDDHEEKGYTE